MILSFFSSSPSFQLFSYKSIASVIPRVKGVEKELQNVSVYLRDQSWSFYRLEGSREGMLGSHGFQGGRKEDQSSPQSKKGGNGNLIADWLPVSGGSQEYYKALRGDQVNFIGKWQKSSAASPPPLRRWMMTVHWGPNKAIWFFSLFSSKKTAKRDSSWTVDYARCITVDWDRNSTVHSLPPLYPLWHDDQEPTGSAHRGLQKASSKGRR